MACARLGAGVQIGGSTRQGRKKAGEEQELGGDRSDSANLPTR